MASILKISEAATLGLHAASVLATEPGQTFSTRSVAKTLSVSENHLSKVMQRLHKAGVVASVRGPKGGFRLERDPASVTLLEVFEALEGPLEDTTCLLGRKVCMGICLLGDLLGDLNRKVRDHLATKTLSNVPRFGK